MNRQAGLAAMALVLLVGLHVAPAAADGNEAPGAPIATRSITAGVGHTCALFVDGSVKCWGDNGSGQLGLGDTLRRGNDPGEMGAALAAVDLGEGARAQALSAGDYHTCALLVGGAVKCWGENLFGRLGVGDNLNRGDGDGEMGDDLPAVDLGEDRRAVAISAGGEHTCALLDDATVKCWGRNAYGQLGLGDDVSRGNNPNTMGDALPAVALGTGRTATAVTTGLRHTCALLDNASIKCWGSGDGGVGLGDSDKHGDEAGEMGDSLPPVALGTGRTAIAVSAGVVHTCAVLDNGDVKCWGRNLHGALGLGTVDVAYGDGPDEMGDDLPRVELGNGRTATAVTAGRDLGCARLDDATVKCWGANALGQLGQGDTNTRGEAPGQMGDLLHAVDIAPGQTTVAVTAGDSHICARLADGNVKCWGNNQYGQLGQGDRDPRGDAPGQMGDDLPVVDLDAPVPEPSFTAVLEAGPSRVPIGSDIHLTITITNTGNVDLSELTIADTAVPDCAGPRPELAPGATDTIDCTYTTTGEDAGMFTNRATIDSDQTGPADTNEVEVAVGISPDLTLKKDGGPTVGDDVHGTDGADQTVIVGRERGGRVTFFVRLQNDGEVTDNLGLRRIGRSTGLQVRYFRGRSATDITGGVVNRTFEASLAPGAGVSVRVEVSITRTAPRVTAEDVVLRTRSSGAPSFGDTVVARVQVR